MSRILLEDSSGLKVSEYTGPELGITVKGDPLSADRRRIQITNGAGMLVTLSAAEWAALGEFVSWDCAPDCEGPHLRCDGWCRHPGLESKT